jgi:hypothetical protein
VTSITAADRLPGVRDTVHAHRRVLDEYTQPGSPKRLRSDARNMAWFPGRRRREDGGTFLSDPAASSIGVLA